MRWAKNFNNCARIRDITGPLGFDVKQRDFLLSDASYCVWIEQEPVTVAMRSGIYDSDGTGAPRLR